MGKQYSPFSFTGKVLKLQAENPKTLILADGGAFFNALGKDAIFLHEKLGWKLNYHGKDMVKVGYGISNSKSLIPKLKELGYSFQIYTRDEDNDFERLYNFKGKPVEETRTFVDIEGKELNYTDKEDILDMIRQQGEEEEEAELEAEEDANKNSQI